MRIMQDAETETFSGILPFRDYAISDISLATNHSIPVLIRIKFQIHEFSDIFTTAGLGQL